MPAPCSQSTPLDREQRARLIGWLTLLGSALCFYLATAIISWARPHVHISAPYYTFARFLLGFAVVCLTMAINGQRLHPRRYHLLIGRTVTNAVAVYCFYRAVEVSSVAAANILNMTYPLFVALFSWFLLREERDPIATVVVLASFGGIWLVLSPGDIGAGWNSLWGLASGLTAGFAIIYLNLSRKHHDSQTILFFMFGLGALLMPLCFPAAIHWPSGPEFLFLLACSAAGVLGQYLLTYGFLYVTAVEGSVISSSRILIAALLGPILVADPPLTALGWLGALIIFAANIILALRRAA